MTLKRKIINFFFIGSLLLILFLNGCSTKNNVSYNQDTSDISDTEYQTKKSIKYTNKSTYRVHGKKYHVMKSAKNYEERGLASWYGKKFDRQRTSSGERYNMLSMTAAHKTLPIPTYVQVTNEKNGNKVIVKVNDRGPFSPNRLIDLSYVAAKKLGMIGHGTTYVKIKAIDPEEAYQHPELLAKHKSKQPIHTAQSHRPKVYLHVGSYRNKAYAEKIQKKLRPMVSSPVQVSRLAQTSPKFYRVKIGPIKDLSTANTIKKKLRTIGLTSKHVQV